MPSRCAACGSELPTVAAKFCVECGAPVAAQPSVEVRKTVTLLFTDVTGSTALGEALDPEALRSVMGRYFDVARAAVERHGGVVEKFVGDAVLAVFGLPEVREDDAVRAVRAAADLQAAIVDLAAELAAHQGVVLAIRTGVNTGPVVTGADRAGGSFATGDAVNTAARLEQAAGPGEVLLGEATYLLVRDAVEVVEVDPVVAKGKAEPVRAYRLVRVDGAASGRSRRMDAPLIGREREIRTLDDALARTVESGRGHLVTVTGAPGIGKTRLVADFLDRAGERAAVLSGRCVSYGQGITYFPLVQILRDGAGLAGTESPEVTRHAVAEVLAGLAIGDRLTELLLPLLGAGGEPASAEDTHEAVTRFLEQVALRRPVVVQVDDLHWAEPPLLDLLDQVRRETADLPLLLVGQARPELLETRPSWGQGATNAVTIGLEPFDSGATNASVTAILGHGVPVAVEHAVTQWSGGNPLFVEEIVTHLRETGMIAATETGWTVVGDLDAAGVPATVSALLAARLERLPAAERTVLQAVSVVGLELTGPEAVALAGPDCVPVLATLAHRDLLRRVRGPAGDTWAFRHVLIREAAYDALPKTERIRLHTLLADHLTTQLAADETVLAGGEQAAFIAHHRLRAASYAAELAPHAPTTTALADTAALAVLASAERTIRGESVNDTAIEAVLALPVTTSVRKTLIVTQLVHCEEDYQHDRLPVLLDELEQLLAAGPSTELEQRCLDLSRLVMRFNLAEPVDPADLRRVATEVREMALDAGDLSRVQLSLIAMVGSYAMDASWSPIPELLSEHVGSGRRALDGFVQGWRHAALLQGPHHFSALAADARDGADRAVTRPERSWNEANLQLALVAQGDPEAVAAVDENVVRLRIELAARPTSVMVLAQVLELAGRLSQSVEVLTAMVADMMAVGDVTHASTYLALQALQEYECGADADRVSDLIEQAAALTSPHDVVSTALVARGRALVALHQGRADDARSQCQAAVETIDRSDQTWERASTRRQVAEIPRALGDVETERELLAEAHALYESKGIVTWQAELESRLADLDRPLRA